MGLGAFTRARDRVLASDRAQLPARAVCEEIVRAFHDVMAFSWSALMLTDPRTLLPCGGVVEGFPAEACGPFWDNELRDADFMKFNELARRSDPVATLVDAVDGDLARSPRYVKLYAPLGAADELRIAFVAGTTCLAIGAFVREADAGPFSREEVEDARQLTAVATGALRRAIGRVSSAEDTEPIVILLNSAGAVIGTTAGGGHVLDDLGLATRAGGALFETDVPEVIRAAASKARWSRTASDLTTRLHSRGGKWLRLHVSPMEHDPEVVAVTVVYAPAHEVTRIVLESYGLTARESDVAQLLCRGLAAKDIAAELAISPHTVRDHTKAIYEKAEVSSRGELVAKLLSNNVLTQLETAVSRLH